MTKQTADEIMAEALAAFGGGLKLDDITMPTGPAPRTNRPSKLWASMDASGSMSGYEEVTKSALTEFVLNIAQQTHNCDLTIETFSHYRADRLLVDVPIQTFNPHALDGYRIISGTAIYDMILEVSAELRKTGLKGDRNIFVIQTDGHDYDSHHGPAAAALAVSKLRREGWEVVFIGGAVQEDDQWMLAKTAKLLGILPTHTLCYDMRNTAALSELGKNIGGYIAGNRDSTGFTEAQRKLAGDLRKHTQSLTRSDTTKGIKDKGDGHRKLLSGS